MFLTQKKYLTNAGQKTFFLGKQLEKPLSILTTQSPEQRYKSEHVKSISLYQKISSSDATIVSYPTSRNIDSQLLSLKLPDISSLYKSDTQDLAPSNKKGIQTFSISNLFRNQRKLIEQNQNQENPQKTRKRLQKYDQYNVEINLYMEQISLKNGRKQQLLQLTKLCDELKPTELPTLSQLSLKFLEEKQISRTAWQKRTQICGYFYDMIVVRQELSFSLLIEMYLEVHDIKRGILTMGAEIFLNDSNVQFGQTYKANGLSRTQGIDLKILKVLFQKQSNRPMYDMPILDIIKDPYFSDHFKFRYDLKPEDIIMRFLSGFDLPDEMYENLSSIVMKKRINISDHSIAYRDSSQRVLHKEILQDYGSLEAIKQNLIKLNFDVDFLKKLIYFQKNLEQTLQNRQSGLNNNLKSSMMQHKNLFQLKINKREKVPLKQDISEKLNLLEIKNGPYDFLSIKERFDCRAITEQEQIQQEVKQNLLYDYVYQT